MPVRGMVVIVPPGDGMPGVRKALQLFGGKVNLRECTVIPEGGKMVTFNKELAGEVLESFEAKDGALSGVFNQKEGVTEFSNTLIADERFKAIIDRRTVEILLSKDVSAVQAELFALFIAGLTLGMMFQDGIPQ